MDPVWLTLAAHATDATSIFKPTSPPAYEIRSLSILVFAITGFIFLVVEGVLIYCVVRFRRRTGETTNEPPQFYGSKPIEIAWTAGPAVIVLVLMLVTTRALFQVNINLPPAATGDHALFVRVIGRQWWWEYHYETYDGRKLGFIAANELHVPVSSAETARPVYLRLESADVCHSFWVPRLGGKTDLIPNKENAMWFQTTEPGLYLGQCAEYCGTQHAGMLLRVVVEPPEDFERWLAAQARDAVDSPQVEEGRKLFLSQSCVNCHRVRGTTAQGTYAPDLTHLMSRDTLAAGMEPNTPENLRSWVGDPQVIKPGCLMPSFKLSDRDRDLIVDYLLTLK